MASSFKMTEVKLKSLTDVDMLLMVEKGIRDAIMQLYHAIHRYAKANKKYIKDSDKNKESSNFNY